MNPKQILLQIDLDANPIQALNALVSPAHLVGLPILLYLECLGKTRSLIGVMNGSKLGQSITEYIEDDIQLLATSDHNVLNHENPILYRMYYDPVYTMKTGVWELVFLFKHTKQQHLFFQRKEFLMDYYMSKRMSTNFESAYILHHCIVGDNCTSVPNQIAC